MDRKQFLTSLLTTSMILSMAATPAFAETGHKLYVRDKNDSNKVLAVFDIDGSGSFDAPSNIKAYEFSNGSGNTTGDQTNATTDLTIGTAAVSTTISGEKSIGWAISDTDQDLFLTLDLAEPDPAPVQYNIKVNSDTQDAGDNTGISGTATCDVSSSSDTANVGDIVTVTMSPKAGNVITKLNIRNQESDVNLYDVKDQNIQVGGSTYSIVCEADGKITISTSAINSDLYVTALTQPLADYSIHVAHDSHCSANITDTKLSATQSTDVLITPEKNYDVSTISVTDGDYTETLTRSTTTVHVNGKDYKAVWNQNGSVTVTVPSATANVSLYAASAPTDNSYYIQATPGNGVTTNCENALYFQPTEKARITLTPNKDLGITQFKMSNGQETVTVAATDHSFTLGGVTHTVSVNNSSGVVTVLVSPGAGNIQVYDIETSQDTYTIRASADSGITVSKTSQSVKVGKTATITFTPKSNYDVTEIRVTRDGRTYTADPTEDSYIIVNGIRCPMDVASNGRVTLTLNQVTSDMRVYADSDYTGKYDYKVSISCDNHVDASVDTIYVKDGDSKSITFTPENSRYKITEISVRRNGKTYTADPRTDKELVVAGVSCKISVNSKNVVTLNLKDIDDDLLVKASTSYNDRDYPTTSDSHSDISTSGTMRYGNTVTYTITADSGYTIKSITIDDGDNKKTIEPDSSSFTMNGIRYTINTKSDRSMTVKVSSLPSELSIDVVSKKNGSNSNNNNNSSSVIVSKAHNSYINGYADGTFRPDNTITRGATIAMLTRQYSGMTDAQLASYAGNAYADVSRGHVFAGAIGYAASKGYLGDLVQNNQILPSQAITRAEFVDLLCKFEGASVAKNSSSKFSDVSSNHWAVNEINYATSQGWIYGYSNGTFRPENSITRAEIVTIINRVLGRNYSSEVKSNMTTTRTFSDVPTNYWAYQDILEASNSHSIISES